MPIMELPAPPRHLIITVHGIRTFGQWQERLEALVHARDPDAHVEHYKYGYFSCVAFMIPFLRWWVTRRFRRALVAACASSKWDRVDLVSHSFGTHLVGWGLRGIPREKRPKLHTVILAGSVLKPSFPWQELTGDCVGRVVNDCGTQDGILVLNQATVLFTGMAGRVGFAGMSHDGFRNRYFAHGHSGYFVRDGRANDEFMRTWWTPALCTDEPVAVPEDPRDPTPIQGLVAFVLNNAEPIKVAVVLAPFVVLAVVYFGLYQQADTQRAEARRRLVALQVANAEKLSDDGDLSAALVWYGEALRSGGALAERDERVRIATALRQHPRLMHVLFLEESGPRRAEFNPDGSVLAITLDSGNQHGAQLWDVETGVALTPLLGHENTVNSIAFSPDGARVVTASSDHTARLWDSRSGAPLMPPLEHDAQLALVRFSPDGERVLTVGRSDQEGLYRACVWDVSSVTRVGVARDVRSGTLAGAAMVHPGHIGDAAFSPDGRRVATISEDGTTQIWNTDPGDAAGPAMSSGEDSVYLGANLCVAFSSDGQRVLTSNGERVQVWDSQTGTSLAGPWSMEPCSHVEFVDDNTVLGADGDGTTKLWGIGKSAWERGPFPHGRAQAESLSTSNPLGRHDQRLAVAGHDGTARVWDAWTDSPLTPPLRHTGAVKFTQISNDGKRLVTIDVTGIVRIWDVSVQAALVLDQATPSETPNLWIASFSPDGSQVLSVVRDLNAAHLWNAATGEHLFELLHTDAVGCACFSPDGRAVVTGCKDGTARLWDTRTGEPIGAVMQHDNAVTTASFSPDGTRLITGCGNETDGTARVWSASDGSGLYSPIEHTPPIVAVFFSPDGSSVLVAGGASAKLYDVQTGERVTEGPPQNELGLLTAALSPDGLRIATGGLNGIARVWDARTGEPITPPLIHSGGPKNMNMSQRVNHVEFSPNSSLLATASSEGTTRIWNAATGAPAAPPIAGADRYAAFSPDGRWIATAGSSGMVRVWDVRSGAALSPPLRHDQAATCVAFDAHGLRVVSAGLDGTARIWDLRPDDRPAEELRSLSEVLACRRIDETGGLVELTTEELRSRWESLRVGSRH